MDNTRNSCNLLNVVLVRSKAKYSHGVSHMHDFKYKFNASQTQKR